MTRIPSFMLVLLLVAACSDNGTVLGSMPPGGAPNASAAGGSAGGADDTSGAGAEASGGESSSGGSGNAGSAGGPLAVDGGMNAGDGGTSSGGSGGSSAGTSTGGSRCTVGGDCNTQVQNYGDRLAEAQACIPTLGPEPACPYQVPDICGCMVSVQSLDAPETQCYLEALEEARPCYICVPNAPCVAPTGTCSSMGQALSCR